MLQPEYCVSLPLVSLNTGTHVFSLLYALYTQTHIHTHTHTLPTQTMFELRGLPYWGRHATYNGGGYVATLPTSQTLMKKFLAQLKEVRYASGPRSNSSLNIASNQEPRTIHPCRTRVKSAPQHSHNFLV